MLNEIKVELKGIEPPVWRTLQVPSRTSLLKLHRILQRAMGWTNSHLHRFEIDGKHYGEPGTEWDMEVLDSRKMNLEKIFFNGTKSFVYEYDLGDGWKHDVTIMGTVEVEGKEQVACTAGARACPPEDCGGVGGYYQLLVAISDPDHEEHDTMLEWVGGKFDPNAFDISAADRDLKHMK